MAQLLGPAGSGSAQPRQQAAASAALGALMADAPELLYARIMEQLAPLLDRTTHDAVPSARIQQNVIRHTTRLPVFLM